MKTLNDFLGIVKSMLSAEDGKLDIVSGNNSVIDTNLKDVDLDGSFNIFKNASGRYAWIAIYSNSFRDDDGTPEIISSGSHKDFVANVDAGIYNYPDLYLWHVPEWKFGKATVVAYDEVEPGIVFAIAGGTIDEGKEFVAEALLESGIQWQMSHGMPTGGIQRYADDRTVYAKHISTEVSVLSPVYAANHLTGFGVLEDNMIPAKKRDEIKAEFNVDDEWLDRLEASNKDVAVAEKGSREFKETDATGTTIANTEGYTDISAGTASEVVATTATVIDESVETVIEEVEEVEEVEADVVDEPASIDLQGLIHDLGKDVHVLNSGMTELKEMVGLLVGAVEVVNQDNAAMKEQVDAIEKAKSDEVAALTPTFSQEFGPRIKSIIGEAATEVTNEDNLSGPSEEKAAADQFGSLIGELVAKSSAQ